MTDSGRIPAHVAVIMDGNGRWAKQRGLSRTQGHRAGAKAVERLADACLAAGIRYVTLFCFSSENWNRPQAEIAALFKMLDEYLHKELAPFRQKGINAVFTGQIDRLPAGLQKTIRDFESQNLPAEQEKMRLNLAISYGGREEITQAARRLAQQVETGALKSADITETLFERALYRPDIPDPDLLIRTSGELRISNFLLWQLAYTELYFTDTLWPDFSAEDLHEALTEYAKRQRRFGKV
ncbi:MAG TPA: di-trans,poly-cis-decaprenylcistransferase [Alphaproteobacteria bacterium]|nr:di-trans,poly-cis-decaprenylcistransferase [Alphaproteobacteria bacterium]